MANIARFIAHRLNDLSGGRFKRHLLEAAVVQVEADPAFRRMGTTKRDLHPLQYDRAMQLSFEMWKRNPLARRIVEIFVDFCMGDEFAVKAKIKQRTDEGDVDTERTDAQEIWDEFYSDPVNNLEDDLTQFVQDLFINGELVNPVTVNETNGAVRIGYIDPQNVREVITDPRNVRRVLEVKISPPNSVELVPLRVIQVDVDPNSLTFNRRVGQTFFFRINRVVNQTRGHGILVDLLDWLDAFDQFLFDSLEGIRIRNAFFYDVEMQGLSEDELLKKAADVFPPTNGSVRLHNELVKYNILSPQLASQDVNQAMLTFITFIVGSKGFPLMWFGHGGETNKSTAFEMAKPTLRMLKRSQKYVRRVIKEMFYFVVDQAIIANRLRLADDEYVDCEVSLVDLERQDTTDVITGFREIVTAMTYAVEKGWISDETAKKLVDSWMKRLGIEVDEGETVEQNLKKAGEEDVVSVYKKVGKLDGEEA